MNTLTSCNKERAISFYDRYNVHNQYYVDRANFSVFSIPGRKHGYVCLDDDLKYVYVDKDLKYDDALSELDKNGLLLAKIEKSNINNKMCQIALSQNIRAVEYIPEDMLMGVFIEFDTRYKDSRNKSRDSLIIDAVLGKMESSGISLYEGNVLTPEKYRQSLPERKKASTVFYTGIEKEQYDEDRIEFITYDEDRIEFATIVGKSSPFDGMSYDEVLWSLNCEGDMLKYIPKRCRNRVMCEVALASNNDSKIYVPRKHLKDIEWQRKVRGYTLG